MRPHLVAIVGALLATACTPTCRQTCVALLDCEVLELDDLGFDECRRDCLVQEDAYERREDEQDDATGKDAFDEFHRCVADSSCDDLADGVCYQDELFPF